MRRVMLCLLVCMLLTGCEPLPFARELESTMLVQVLGVDWTEKEVVLTAASDPGAGGGTAVLSASGQNFQAAKEALKGAGEQFVSLTHVTQIVLGENCEHVAVLEAALREPVLGQNATVWLAEEGTAKNLMAAVNGGARRLSSIELNGGANPVTVLKSLMNLRQNGRVELPVLSIEKETLEWSGMETIQEEVHEV